MKKVLSFMKDYKKESILGPLFKLLEASFELFVPIVVAQIIDIGIKNADRSYIIQKCLVLVLLAFVGLVCAVVAQFFAAKASVGFAKKLKNALFGHIQSLSFAEIDRLGTSAMINRMTNDVNQVQNGVNLTIRLLLRSPFVVFGAMIVAFTIDVPSAWIFAVAIPVLSAVVFGIMLTCIPLYKKVQQSLDRVLCRTRENLTGVRVIRAFCKEESEQQAFEEENSGLVQIQKHVGKISALMNPVTYVIINIAVIVLIHTGGLRVDSAELSQGDVVALYNLMSQILVELIKLANLIITITKAVACGKRIETVFELQPSITCPDKLTEKENKDMAVRFDNVSLRYQGAADTSLSGISFEAKKGETIGIIGSTGSGKSSLVNMIPRFYDTESGTVYVNGIDVKKYPAEILRERVGIVLQKAVLFKGSIRENIRWGKPDASDDEIMSASEAAQAKEIIDGKDGGLDHIIEQGGRNLSGGQRQRLTIARALVRRPEILILDDSASALDFATDARLRKAIRELDYDPTVFIVSQRTSSVQYADKIIVLDDGKIVGLGTHDRLLEECAVYKEIYSSQFKKEVG
ncbi:MAG: ABC transporter ATP-binding protein [Oscillospiraceae bacterium]|nr:ABC transporter ATP-binding protein [Oscillospiraceae bacterium]